VMKKICFDLPIDFSGVDLITPDITQDPYSNNSALNEINSAPMPDATYYANIGSSDPLKQVRDLIMEIAKV
jgi:D-alanine-D-alanine ligase-like ATP-grasp enzyme